MLPVQKGVPVACVRAVACKKKTVSRGGATDHPAWAIADTQPIRVQGRLGALAPPSRAIIATDLIDWAEKMRPFIQRQPPLTPAQIAERLGQEMDIWFGRIVRTVVDILPGLQDKSRVSGIIKRAPGKRG